jgi:Protein of unknown function (DUF4240)
MRRFGALPVLALAVAVLAIGFAIRGSNGDSRTLTAPAPTALETPAAQAPAAEVPAADGPAAPAPEAPPAPMTPAAFWSLIGDTRGEAGASTERQSELLDGRLEKLPDSQQKRFDAIRHGLDQRAYTWDVWGAAYVIEDGCSDDCFQDFRMYLISLGRDRYEAALRDPDSLASLIQDPEAGQWEAALDAGPGNFADLSGNPRGEPWDDEHVEELLQRYPALAERFR